MNVTPDSEENKNNGDPSLMLLSEIRRQHELNRRLSIKPYISFDVSGKGPSVVLKHPELLDLTDSFFSNHMKRVKEKGKAVFYKHSGYGEGREPNFCLFRVSNLGEGVAYRLSVANIKRYVHESTLKELFQNDQEEKMYCHVESNVIILPTSREFPVRKIDDVDSYTYSDHYSFTVCVDIGPNADDDIEVEFFDINDVHYKQRFFRIKNTATPPEYEDKVCRYRSDHPVIIQ
jgi:hypothetical protein